MHSQEQIDRIAQKMGVSGARVAIVRLTSHGADTVNLLQQELYEQICLVIDRVGQEKLDAFIAIGKEIHEALLPPSISI